MKYSGSMVGFQSSYGSIYNIITDDTKCYALKANVTVIIIEKMMTIAFNWNGESYEIRLSELKENYYTGKVLFNKEPGGEAFFWRFNNNQSLLLKGDFIEDEAGNYTCFVELNPLKA